MRQTITDHITRHRNLSCRLAALSFILAVFNLQAFTYTNFSSTNGLNLMGVASIVGGALRLTLAADSVNGEAWAQAKQPCASGFDTSFQFRISNPGSRPGTPSGSDGILFTLQNVGPTDPNLYDIGSPADGNVTVIFNTFWNWPDSTDFTKWDVSANSVGVLSNGLYLAQTDLTPRGINLKDGASHNARIAFDGTGLTVWLDGGIVLTNVPVPGMASAVDATGNAWVGFGAGTGWAWENHDVLSWSFSPSESPGCVPSPSGQVSWWKGEGNALDQVDGNNGVLFNGAGFDAGIVGQAFRFNGSSNSYVEVADSPTLRFTNALTIECWAKRLNTSEKHALVDKGGDWTGGQTDYEIGLNDTFPGGSKFDFEFGGGGRSCPVTLDTAWHHYAAVAVNGQADPILYIDGVPQAINYRVGLPTVVLRSSTRPLDIGAQLDPQTGWFYYSSTMIDELAIFNRALSATEIQSIYNAGSAGKCPPGVAPSIITQPVSLAVNAGSTVSFSVSASGTAPLSYQWQFSGSNIVGATGTSLSLSNVQSAQAGSYVVRVTNIFGSILSSNALLTVTSSPPCVPPPSGLVSWWRGEGNALDQVSGNNGVLFNGAGFDAGIVGQAFRFNGGSNSYVEVADSPTLRFTNALTIECWAKRLNTSEKHALVDKGGDWTGGQTDFEIGLNDTFPGGSKFDFEFGGGGRSCPVALDTAWHHYAAVAVNGQADPILYVDGMPQAITYRVGLPTVVLRASTRPLDIGAQLDPQTGWFYYSSTMIDELALYNRALSAAEVQAIYNAGSAGKCPAGVAPSIITQPASLAVLAGATAVFSVTAAGAAPLSYQWQFSGSNIAGATSTALSLSNVQSAQAGNYAVRVTNAFGSITSSNALLTVNQTPPCVPPPSGLVSWWRGEGAATDFAGTNNGVLEGGMAFATGEVGQAFKFNGTNADVRVLASASLNVGLADGFTIETWINPADLTQERPVVEWNDGEFGVHLWVSSAAGAGPGALYINVKDTTPHDHPLSTAAGLLSSNVWQHVAATYMRSNGNTVLYINGVARAQATLGVFTPRTIGDLYFGLRPYSAGAGLRFVGMMDEVSLYSRTLSATEIQAIYNAGSAGKCPLGVAPSIITQPASLAVLAGSTAAFSVTAAGTPPLSYQWRFNGTNVAGATGTLLTLSNVQPAQAGNYSVRVTNLVGSTVSSNATLTVNRVPVALCADVVVSAGADCQANASINHGSFDPDGDPITISQVPSGPYSLGTNRVTLIVTDGKGASNSCSALVIVRDTTPPVLACPGSKVLEFQDEKGTVATYSATATDTCSAVALVLTPPSGSVFPIGVTPVQVQATDGGSNSVQCSFTVTVLGAQGVKSNVLAQLVALRASVVLTEAFAQVFDDAILNLGNSLNPAYWIDQTHLQPRVGNTAMIEEKLTAGELKGIMEANKCPVDPAVLQGFIDRIVKSDRLLAVISIQDATKAGLSARKVAEALAMVAAGDRAAAAGYYANAIEDYRLAWRHVLQLRLQVSLNADGTTHLQFVGGNSQSYRIEMSTDMVKWASLGTCTADAEGNVEFSDPNVAKQSLRFYRAVEQ